MRERRCRRIVAIVLSCAVSAVTGACGTTSSTSPTTTGSPAATAAPAGTAPRSQVVTATLVGEREVSPAYRQGLAHTDNGWVFSMNLALYQTDDEFVEVAATAQAIPAEWAAKGYNHIGDIDIVGNVVYAPIEQPDNELGRQAMFRYDATTLQFLDAVEVAQHHNSFVTVDPATMIAYTTDFFDDDALMRYDVAKGWAPLPPIRMSKKIGHIQGADLAGGAAFLSTDDDRDGLYRVDLATGEVQDLPSLGYIDGEGEGIDVREGTTIELQAISLDAKLVPVRVIEFSVSSA